MPCLTRSQPHAWRPVHKRDALLFCADCGRELTYEELREDDLRRASVLARFRRLGRPDASLLEDAIMPTTACSACRVPGDPFPFIADDESGLSRIARLDLDSYRFQQDREYFAMLDRHFADVKPIKAAAPAAPSAVRNWGGSA